MTSAGAQKNKKWQAKNNEMLQEYLFRYSLPRPLAPQWVDWFRIFPISLPRAGSQAIRSARLITFPTLYRRIGGGGCQQTGVGWFSVPKDKLNTHDQEVPNHAVLWVRVYTKLNFGMDAMNKSWKSLSGDTLTTAKNLVFFLYSCCTLYTLQ
jgi:hypothetical protein